MADGGGSEELPTGTVTFLFTDIEGSTPLWDSFPTAMRTALARHDEIVRTAIGGAGGHMISTSGDGFAAVFARAGPAVEAAIDAERALSAEVWVGGQRCVFAWVFTPAMPMSVTATISGRRSIVRRGSWVRPTVVRSSCRR